LVNASLNWASIVGIVLAVGGALLYFMRSFKPALARDYDVFFAAIGLLCGGILFFQGWRLDPILQFGQFLLAGTTVFFAYESVRLRGVATEQARRSAYFDDEPAPARGGPGGLRGGWDEGYDRFDEPEPLRRRFSGRDDNFNDQPQDEYYQPRRPSRAAIPEQAASRRPREADEGGDRWGSADDERSRRMARFRAGEDRQERRADFGDRRSIRQDQRRGSRPIGRTANGSEPGGRPPGDSAADRPGPDRTASDRTANDRTATAARPSRPAAEEAAFTAKRDSPSRPTGRPTAGPDNGSRPAPRSSRSSGSSSSRSGNSGSSMGPRDNSSRFDD